MRVVKKNPSLLILFVAMAFVSCWQGERALTHGQEQCSDLRRVSEDPIVAPLGSWRIFIGLQLIGCQEDLDKISEEEIACIVEEIKNPSQWSNLLLISDARDPQFRSKVTTRINEIMGRDVVRDVVFYEVSVQDHVGPYS